MVAVKTSSPAATVGGNGFRTSQKFQSQRTVTSGLSESSLEKYYSQELVFSDLPQDSLSGRSPTCKVFVKIKQTIV